jgi:prepilin-type N-terminal cleavage/methylation domain-containing protein
MRKQSFNGGFTLIELMLVVAILAVLASIVTPRFDLLLQKATQSTSKGNLGSIRSTLGLYYADMEGAWPMAGIPDGYADANNVSLTQVLTPRYIERIPKPRLAERVGSFNGLNLVYDDQVNAWFEYSPPKDTVILRGPAAPTPFINRPFVYDPDTGLLYLCNGNYDHSGVAQFYSW